MRAFGEKHATQAMRRLASCRELRKHGLGVCHELELLSQRAGIRSYRSWREYFPRKAYNYHPAGLPCYRFTLRYSPRYRRKTSQRKWRHTRRGTFIPGRAGGSVPR